MKLKKGYNLLEMCIVLSVLCGLSMVLLPYFGRASQQARVDDIKTSLMVMNDAIDLYKLDHSGRLPGAGKTGFVEGLMSLTDKFGTEYTDKSERLSLVKCGPYINAVPVNPFNDLSTVRINGPAAGARTHGWRYDTATGKFEADTFKGDKFSR